MTKGKQGLYFNAGKIAHFSSTYKKINNEYSVSIKTWTQRRVSIMSGHR